MEKHIKIGLIIAIILILSALCVLWFYTDHQANLKIKETTRMITQSEFTICQFNTCVDFNTGEISVNKQLVGCLDVKNMTFCGAFVITKKK